MVLWKGSDTEMKLCVLTSVKDSRLGRITGGDVKDPLKGKNVLTML